MRLMERARIANARQEALARFPLLPAILLRTSVTLTASKFSSKRSSDAACLSKAEAPAPQAGACFARRAGEGRLRTIHFATCHRPRSPSAQVADGEGRS